MNAASLRSLTYKTTAFIVLALPLAAAAQPWDAKRADLASVLREESDVDYVIDSIATEDLGLDAVRCCELRLNGLTYTIGFRNKRIDLVEFSPSYSQCEPNWYITLSRLFGDHPMRNNWVVDQELTSLFPSITWSQITPFPDTKPAKSRTITFNQHTGQVVDVSPWYDDAVPTGRIRWSASSSELYRCVLRRRDGKAYAIVEGSRTHAQEVVPHAANLIRPFAHHPRDVRRVMVAAPDVFFGYLIRACSRKLGNGPRGPHYGQQFAGFVDPANRASVRNDRLVAAVRSALQRSEIPVETIGASIDKSDRRIVLAEFTGRRRLSRDERRRTLLLVGEIGGIEQVAYCKQFENKPAFRTQVSAALAQIAKREARSAAKRRAT
ncbi:MAG: hypothetical protein KDB27_26195 [Planctomycetales bacterium]|nr:hypothetical protein [Planctomycetales bacterium]